MQLRQAHELVGMIDVLIPVIRLEAAQRAGHGPQADSWLQQAVHAARRPPAAPLLLPFVLVTGQRFEEARSAIEQWADQIADAFEFQLRVQAKDYANAAHTLDRIEAAGTSKADWHHLLAVAELRLGLGEVDTARNIALRAVSAFEDSLKLLMRDPERIDACDQPDVAGLYATLARTWLASTDGTSPASADASFEAAERGRSLTWQANLQDVDADTRRSWQRAAAEYAAVSNRLLVALNQASPT